MAENQKYLTTTKVASLATLTPRSLNTQYRGVQTVEQAIAVKADRISALIKAYSPEKVAALIKLQLIELNDLLDLKRPLSEAAIDLIADEVITTHKHLTFADVYLIFRRARNGEYGQFYESINMPKVMSWFAEYFDERCEVAATLSQREAQQHKSGFGGHRTGDGRKELREVMRKANVAYLTGKL